MLCLWLPLSLLKSAEMIVPPTIVIIPSASQNGTNIHKKTKDKVMPILRDFLITVMIKVVIRSLFIFLILSRISYEPFCHIRTREKIEILNLFVKNRGIDSNIFINQMSLDLNV